MRWLDGITDSMEVNLSELQAEEQLVWHMVAWGWVVLGGELVMSAGCLSWQLLYPGCGRPSNIEAQLLTSLWLLPLCFPNILLSWGTLFWAVLLHKIVWL